MDIKHVWVKKIRQLIQDTYFGTSKVSASLPSLSVPNQNSHRNSINTSSQRSSREFDAGSLDESIENLERGSLASFGSGGTTDSEGQHRVSKETVACDLKDISAHSVDNPQLETSHNSTVRKLQKLIETLSVNKT